MSENTRLLLARVYLLGAIVILVLLLFNEESHVLILTLIGWTLTLPIISFVGDQITINKAIKRDEENSRTTAPE